MVPILNVCWLPLLQARSSGAHGGPASDRQAQSGAQQADEEDKRREVVTAFRQMNGKLTHEVCRLHRHRGIRISWFLCSVEPRAPVAEPRASSTASDTQS